MERAVRARRRGTVLVDLPTGRSRRRRASGVVPTHRTAPPAHTDLTDVIVHDIFSPPVASRIYVYPSIAAYECAKFLEGNYQSLSGQLNGLDRLPSPENGQEYSYELAAITAFNKVAKTFIFSEEKLYFSSRKT